MRGRPLQGHRFFFTLGDSGEGEGLEPLSLPSHLIRDGLGGRRQAPAGSACIAESVGGAGRALGRA